ncbi:ADM_HP2_G0024770.mRNA.1.CDS.1 [Saccharomyces cerevisiae]|nr:ADM_HP2_G0024770.mRNA.1.CDS.1 [Saccharomyces cerevisiae]CAI6450549.1 ADM_HP2_G0024770.mRNA.1.CDS.1 [Saccharomyces cerevisiae]
MEIAELFGDKEIFWLGQLCWPGLVASPPLMGSISDLLRKPENDDGHKPGYHHLFYADCTQ